MDEGLVDRIYEASFLPELWPMVLDSISALVDAEGGWFMALGPGGIRWTGSEAFAGGLSKWASNGWLARTDRVRRGIRAAHPGFLTELDLYGPGEMEADLFYRRFLWKVGLGWGAGTVISAPTLDTLLLTFERRRERGPVEASHVRVLDGLRPHLARSALTSARLSLERARAVGAALEAVGLPALVFDPHGRAIAVNGLVESVSEVLSWRSEGRLGFCDRRAQALWAGAVLAVASGCLRSVQSFAVRDRTSVPVLVGHVVPMRGAARDIFDRCAGMLILTPVQPSGAPPADLLRSLFDFTAAEAGVARGIAVGESIAEMAASRGLSRNTLKTHVRLVMEKTGCVRQVQVAALLGGIARPVG